MTRKFLVSPYYILMEVFRGVLSGGIRACQHIPFNFYFLIIFLIICIFNYFIAYLFFILYPSLL